MKIDSHKNVKVNIFKTKNKFNGKKHKDKKKAPTKMYLWALHFSEAIHLLGSNGNHLERFLGAFSGWYSHHQLTVNAVFPNMTISENTTSNKTSLGKLLEDA